MVKLESTIKRYLGLSTDDKPIYEDAQKERRIPAGSSFLETDTGRIYRFDGSEWKYAVEKGTEELLSAILFEIRSLRERVEFVTG